MGRMVNVSTLAGDDHNRWLATNAVDPQPGPLEADIMEEERQERLRSRNLIPPGQPSDWFVRVFLTGCAPWDNVIRVECPVCKGLPKPPGWYCGRCDTPKGTAYRKLKPKPGPSTAKPLAAHVETRREKRARKGKGREAA